VKFFLFLKKTQLSAVFRKYNFPFQAAFEERHFYFDRAGETAALGRRSPSRGWIFHAVRGLSL
jgi:hypothetical protein